MASAANGRNLLGQRFPVGRAITAGGMGLMGLYSTFDRAKEADTPESKAAWNATGYGELASALKLGAGAVNDWKNPPLSFPSDKAAEIETAIARAKMAPEDLAKLAPQDIQATPLTPAEPQKALPAPEPKPREVLRLTADAYDVPYKTRTTSAEIKNKLGEALASTNDLKQAEDLLGLDRSKLTVAERREAITNKLGRLARGRFAIPLALGPAARRRSVPIARKHRPMLPPPVTARFPRPRLAANAP